MRMKESYSTTINYAKQVVIIAKLSVIQPEPALEMCLFDLLLIYGGFMFFSLRQS